MKRKVKTNELFLPKGKLSSAEVLTVLSVDLVCFVLMSFWLGQKEWIWLLVEEDEANGGGTLVDVAQDDPVDDEDVESAKGLADPSDI